MYSLYRESLLPEILSNPWSITHILISWERRYPPGSTWQDKAATYWRDVEEGAATERKWQKTAGMTHTMVHRTAWPRVRGSKRRTIPQPPTWATNAKLLVSGISLRRSTIKGGKAEGVLVVYRYLGLRAIVRSWWVHNSTRRAHLTLNGALCLMCTKILHCWWAVFCPCVSYRVAIVWDPHHCRQMSNALYHGSRLKSIYLLIFTGWILRAHGLCRIISASKLKYHRSKHSYIEGRLILLVAIQKHLPINNQAI